MDLKASGLKINLGLIFIEPPLKSSPIKIVILFQKRSNTPTQINSQVLKPLYLDILVSFAIWGNDATITHLPHDFTPTITYPTKHSNIRCIEYVAFECHAKFQVSWESFTHKATTKTHDRICYF